MQRRIWRAFFGLTAALTLTSGQSLAGSPEVIALEFFALDADAAALDPVAIAGGKTLAISAAVGSGAYHRAGDPANVVYTVTDRGPSFDCEDAQDIASVDGKELCATDPGAKVYAAPEFTPTIYELALEADGVARIRRAIPLLDRGGTAITGLSNPLQATDTEVVLGPAGRRLPFDPSAVDPEAIVRLADGSFWLAEEFGPSLVHVAADGRIVERLVPAGLEKDLAAATYPVSGKLPTIFMRRKLNRGIESLAVAPDERQLYFAEQSALANPDLATYKASPNVRIVRFDLARQTPHAQFLYRLDPPGTFAADQGKKKRKQKDVKISDMVALDRDLLIVLERLNKTTKLYLVDLGDAAPIPTRYDELATSPTLEQLGEADLAAAGVAPLGKRLLLDSSDLDGMPRKIEGMALVSANQIVLVNDDDFGIEGERTTFVRVTFADALGGQ